MNKIIRNEEPIKNKLLIFLLLLLHIINPAKRNNDIDEKECANEINIAQ